MRARFPTSLVASLAVLLLLGVGVVGCDSVGPGAELSKSGPDQSADEESFFEATNTLEGRMETMGKSVTMSPFGDPTAKTSAASASEPSLSLTSIAQVDPPGDTTRASHLTYSDGTIYAGYKALGAPFKGGIDILDATDPTNILDVSSLGADGLDVQEVAYDGNEDALYVAAAAGPSSPVGENSSLLVKVTNFSSPTSSSVGLAGQLGKSVVIAPDGDQEHDVYAVTDEETLHRFNAGLGNEATEEVQGVEFRSVAATSDEIFTVDRAANTYSSSVQSAGGLTEETSIGSGVGDLAIGRLHARDEPVLNGERLFLALGSEGIAVLDAADGDVLFRDDSRYYTSLTLHEDDSSVQNGPTDLVYAARPSGIIDVYQVGSGGMDTGNPSTGLDEVGTFDLSDLGGVNFGTSPQVNQVMGVGCNVYIANSNEGVVALEIDGTSGCGGGGNQAPTANDDSDNTTAGQPTTTDVLANDSDDGNDIDPSTVTVQSAPSEGSTSVDGSTGEITYTPNDGFTGSDSYTYTVKDGDGAESNSATVTITVNEPEAPAPPGDAKSISFVAYCTTEPDFSPDDVSIVDTKENNQGEVVSIAWTSDTELSTVVLKAGNSLYNYEGGFAGGAASGAGDTAGSGQTPPNPCPNGETLIVKNESVNNESPTASDDSGQTSEGQPTTTDVLANDSDPDGNLDPATVQVQSGPSDGSVTVNNDGTIDYTPDNGFTGDDTYTYTVKDGDGAESNEATVTITVNSDDDGDQNTAATDGCSGALGGGVAFTDNGDLKTVPGDGGAVSLLYGTPSNAPVRTLGTGVDLDDDGNVGVVFAQENPNGAVQTLKVIDKDATSPTTYSLPHTVKVSKSLLNVGSWDGSDPSAFYVAATGNGDQIFRVSFNTGNTHAVANPANGVDAIIGIADIDGDNNDELAFSDGSEDTRYVEQGDNVDQTFTEVPDGGAGSNNNIGIGSCLADVDGDGKAAIPIIGGSNQITLVDADGVDDTIMTGNASEQAAKTPLAWGDVDADGTPELVYLENNNSPAELRYVDDVGGANSFKLLRDSDGDPIPGDTERGVVSAQ